MQWKRGKRQQSRAQALEFKVFLVWTPFVASLNRCQEQQSCREIKLNFFGLCQCINNQNTNEASDRVYTQVWQRLPDRVTLGDFICVPVCVCVCVCFPNTINIASGRSISCSASDLSVCPVAPRDAL